MRFIHFADTHLGFSDLSKIDPETGLNRREKDFYDAWWHIIEAIVKHKPDFVLHAGDLFQSPRPNNRSIAVAMEGLRNLNEAGIPIFLVAGNHSTPRIRATGSIFEALTVLPNVRAAYRSAYEKFEFEHPASGKRCTIHCIPHCSLSDDLEKAYESVKLDDSADWNLLLTHGCWRSAGKVDTRMGEFNEQFLEDPESRLNISFDYIALGHYHRYLEINEHAVYSGSTERTSFSEAGYTSGYVLGDLQSRKWTYHEIPCRPMRRLASLSCKGKTIEQIVTELEQRANLAALEGAMVSLNFTEMSRDLYLQLDLQLIDKIFSSSLHVDKQFKIAEHTKDDQQAAGDGTLSVGSLREEFSRYLYSRIDEDSPREQLEALGADYLTSAESQEPEA